MSRVRLLAYNDLEGVYDEPARVGRLAGLIESLADEASVVCGAGDDTALGVLPLVTDRRVARPFFEHVQPAAETFGNHDFDAGRADALRLAETAPTSYVCANLPDPAVPNATVVERAGRRVGIVGLTHPETPALCPAVEELSFTDPVAAVERAADRLSVDHLVVCSHCGELDREVAHATDAAAVIGGHRHTERCEVVAGTALVRTAGGGCQVAAVPLDEPSDARLHETADAPIDESVADRYRERRVEAGVDRTVAAVSEPIPRTDRERFRRESRAGNFLADAVRRAAEADVGLFHAGSLRPGEPVEGEVTVGDVVSLAPFDDPIREARLSGRALRATLDGAAVSHSGDRGWIHCHVSGARVQWNADGSLRSLAVGGEPVAAAETYRVATHGWVVAIDAPIAPLGADHVVRDHEPIYEAAVAHAETGGLAATDCEGRIDKRGA